MNTTIRLLTIHKMCIFSKLRKVGEGLLASSLRARNLSIKYIAIACGGNGGISHSPLTKHDGMARSSLWQIAKSYDGLTS